MSDNDSDNGLSDTEIIKLLFKNYMNFTSSLPDKKFYQESLLSNNNNIFSSGILIDTPTVNPSFIPISSYDLLYNYLSYSAIPDVSINNNWFQDKTDMGGTFSVDFTSDENRTILRMENIKLDYLGDKSSAFVCKDLNGKNILQNLIPANYATSGYSMSLKYKNDSDVLMPMNWLTSKSDLATETYINETVSFGGALFDAKNGVITFYDVSGDPDTVFSDVSCNFYLTATKYIGLSNVNMVRSLNIIGDVAMESSLAVSNDIVVQNEMNVEKDVSFGSHLQVVGDVSMESSLEISNNLIIHNELFVEQDVSFDSHLTVSGDISVASDLTVGGSGTFSGESYFQNNVNFGTNTSDVSVVLYGDFKIKAGGNLVIEDSSFSITDLRTEVKITDILDISNDGTGPALNVTQNDTNANDIVHFNDMGVTVFAIKDGGKTDIAGDVVMSSSLDVSENVSLHNELFVDKDVSFGENLTVVGDVTLQSSLDISGIMTTTNEFVFKKDSTERMVIDSSGIQFVNNDPSYTAVDISSTSALGLPVGTSDERPTDEKIGHIRYNTTNSQFEGYGQGVWQGLGGVIDIDQDTKITTDDSNNLIFDTNGSTQMVIDSDGDVSMANDLNVEGNLVIGSSSINVESKIDSLDVSVNYIEEVIGVDEYFVVTVANSGSGNKYIINGIETPIIHFENNKTYRFDQSESSNNGHPLILSTDNSTDTTDVSYQLNIGSPGSNGAYTEITINNDTPNILYYRCQQAGHTSMGSYMKNNINLVDISINSLETATTDISYNSSTTTTIFENNVTVNGSLDVSDVIYASSGMSIGKDKDSEYELDVSGDIHCTGTLFADSDLKVKKNLVPLDKSLDKLSNLNGYYYHKVGEGEDSLKHIGVIAQEVEAEYPELVSKNTDIKSVNYDGINAILIECVKELRKENLAMKTQLEEVKSKLENIEESIHKK
jgi:predicted acyltransferase (DUF342 family)